MLRSAYLSDARACLFGAASVWLTSCVACHSERAAPRSETHAPAVPARQDTTEARGSAREQDTDKERRHMVEEQLIARGIKDTRVLSALREVPRHAFVPEEQVAWAYEDRPLPIGYAQTISQPYIVAAMSELAEIATHDKVLEIGTGSGYQAAVLARLARAVYSIEILPPLAQRARETLARLGIDNVFVRAGDGYQGWPEEAPFAAILVTAAPPEVPLPLKEQLAVGGKLVIPVGTDAQELRVLTRTEHGFEERNVLPVRFVPMTGEAQRGE
jgi:protein-L-isoaspartate(D-aspartate) O-methyltransferase